VIVSQAATVSGYTVAALAVVTVLPGALLSLAFFPNKRSLEERSVLMALGAVVHLVLYSLALGINSRLSGNAVLATSVIASAGYAIVWRVRLRHEPRLKREHARSSTAETVSAAFKLGSVAVMIIAVSLAAVAWIHARRSAERELQRTTPIQLAAVRKNGVVLILVVNARDHPRKFQLIVRDGRHRVLRRTIALGPGGRRRIRLRAGAATEVAAALLLDGRRIRFVEAPP
jgi:hypothetical protein